MMGNLSGIVIGAWILVTAIVVIIDIAGGLNNKDLYRVSMPLGSQVKLYTLKECISAITAAYYCHFGPNDEEVAIIANSLGPDDFDYCIKHAGFSESKLDSFEAFREEFLSTDWHFRWHYYWGG